MSAKTKFIIGAVSLLTSFAFGRYSVPERIKIETRIVEVEKKTEDKTSEAERNKKKTTTVTEVVKPDGTRETTTTTTEETQVSKKNDSHSTDETAKDSSSSKEVVSGQSKVTVLFTPGFNVKSPTDGIIYGASVSKPILGPITSGVFFLTNGIVGANIGLTF